MVQKKRKTGQGSLIWGGKFSGKNKKSVTRAYNRLSKGQKTKIVAHTVVVHKKATKNQDGIYKIWGKKK